MAIDQRERVRQNEESTMNKITVDGNKLIESIGNEDPNTILEIMEIDLAEAKETFGDDAEWQCGVEERWWRITAKQLNLTDLYAVRWTYADEAGIADIEIIERVDDEEDIKDLTAYLQDIAANCGSCNGEVR